MSPSEYKTWIESEESGLVKKKNIGEFEYAMQFQTKEYLLLLNQGPQGFNSELNLENELKEYSDDVQILLTIKNLEGIPPLEYNVTDEMDYYSRIQYLNSSVQNDLCIVSEMGDTSKCLFVHLEQDFGISPEIRLNLAFDLEDKKQDLQVCFNDRIFNNGMVKFLFSKEDLTDLPELTNN